jgi:hypothetical protein
VYHVDVVKVVVNCVKNLLANEKFIIKDFFETKYCMITFSGAEAREAVRQRGGNSEG